MAEVKPLFLDTESYPFKYLRQFWKNLLSEGILSSDALQVTQSDTPAMTVKVGKKFALVQNDEADNLGHYLIENDDYVTKTIAAADPSNPRVDRVIYQIYDSTDIGGAEDKGEFKVLTGTPAGSPSPEALPDNALDLALVAVAAGAATITNANITDQRSLASFQAGIYKFLSFPETPVSAPTTNYQVPNKKYVDDLLAALPSTVQPNLIINSVFIDTNEDNLPSWWSLLATPTLVIAADTLCGFNDNHKQITITGSGAANEGIQIAGGTNNWLKVRPSTTYIFSIYYKVTAGDNLSVHIHSYNGAAEGTAHVTKTDLNSTTAARYTVSFTTDANATNLHIELKATADGDICIVSHPKLELGSIASAYCASNKLLFGFWNAQSMNVDFSTAVPATLTESNGDADQLAKKTMDFTKLDVVGLEIPIPPQYDGGPVLVQYRFKGPAASKTHTMEFAIISRGLSDAYDGAVGAFVELGQDTSDGTIGDIQIYEKLVAAADIGMVAGKRWGCILRRKNAGGDDADEVSLLDFMIQMIGV